MSDYKTFAQKFVESYSKKLEENYWKENLLDLEGGITCSPVDVFYEQAAKACKDGIPSSDSKGRPQPAAYTEENTVRELLEILLKHCSGGGDWDACLKNAEDLAAKHDDKATQEKCARIKNSPNVQNLLHIAKNMDTGQREGLLGSLSSDLARLQPLSAVARETFRPLSARVDAGPGPSDYQKVWETIVAPKDKGFSWCSLIHPYWLDEASLPWTIERLVDRIENGVVSSTRPLLSVRVAETGDLPGVISNYAHSWQQGDLAAVDERRRQYLATYGFPLFSAARWGQLETVDPNRGFPAVFHGFLASALQFYRDSRNTQMIPDTDGVLKVFELLGRALREHNENLRRVRATELRGQMEYVKQVLGGLRNPSPPGPTALQEAWSSALPGRPGVRESMDPWEFAVDTVADLYQWRRPSVSEYRSLAENGEVLLVMARIFTDSGVTLGVQTMWALLEVLREPIRQYTSSYKVVTGVDLGAPNPFLGAPALAMARQQMQPPAIPPLRRSWAVELPAA